jgi:hypothetical protein
VSLEDYEPVAVRLHRLLTQLRDAGHEPSVITHLLSSPGADVCVIRAELWIDGVLRATGHAEEVRGQGNVNRTSHLENCETSAIGRMAESYNPTADAGKRPSREEMQKVERHGGAPAQGGGKLASDKQKAMIRAISKGLGKLAPVHLDDMTVGEASEYIDRLKDEEKHGSRRPANTDVDEEPF